MTVAGLAAINCSYYNADRLNGPTQGKATVTQLFVLQSCNWAKQSVRGVWGYAGMVKNVCARLRNFWPEFEGVFRAA